MPLLTKTRTDEKSFTQIYLKRAITDSQFAIYGFWHGIFKYEIETKKQITMKKLNYIFASILAIFILNQSAMAQTSRGGIKGGLNLSTLYIDDVEDENVRAGFHVGIYTQMMVTDNFAIQPELNFSTKGSRATYDNAFASGESKFNLHYLDIPVLATFKLGDDADIHVGPYFGYLVGVNTSTEGTLGNGYTELDRDDYQKWDYGLAAGVALNFQPLSVGVRYNYGLNKIADNANSEGQIGDAKNAVGQIYLAFNLK